MSTDPMKERDGLVDRLRAHAGFVENGGCVEHSLTDEFSLLTEAANRIEQLERDLAEAVEAMGPFAEAANDAERLVGHDGPLPQCIALHHLRAARRVHDKHRRDG